MADYFRQPPQAARDALRRLVEDGRAEPVTVADLPGDWFLSTTARVPRRVVGAALVSPFDSLVFERQRLERLHGLRYRLEIYVPAAARQHGYYVYPFLLDEAFAARVDLKADRRDGVLLVQAAWIEAGFRPDAVAPALAGELASLATWLGLGAIRVAPSGTLAPALSSALG